MTVLVTGSNGFLGAAVVRRLVARGDRDVRCLVRPGSNTARLEAIERAQPKARMRIFRGTLSDHDSARAACEGVDSVLHLAAALAGAAADIYLNTVVATKHLLEAVAVLPKSPKLVLVSSFGVYGVAGLGRGAVVDETTPLEPYPERRDLYSQAKLRQETLCREYQARHGFELVVLRPGVIYGPTGGGLSSRVGIQLPGVFLSLGHDNVLPLSYVDNCAEAVVMAGEKPEAVGGTFNVHDDDLPTCAEYLREYQQRVEQKRTLSVPYPLLLAGSHLVERYHEYSKGQLPAIFTPYKTRTMWRGQRFSNARLKSLGWQQLVPTAEGMRLTFEYLRERVARAA